MAEAGPDPAIAYIALQVQRGLSNQVVEDVGEIPGVTLAMYALGSIDALVKVEARDAPSLLTLVTQVARSPGVLKTVTYAVVGGGKSKGKEKSVAAIVFCMAYTTSNYSELVERLMTKYDSVNCASLVWGEYDIVFELLGKNLSEIRNTIRLIQENEKDLVSTMTVPVLA